MRLKREQADPRMILGISCVLVEVVDYKIFQCVQFTGSDVSNAL